MLHQFLPVFLATLVIFILFFVCLGLGYLFKKQPLKGSCGGVANLMGDKSCQFCGNDPNKCPEVNADNNLSEKAKRLGQKA